MRVEKSMKKKSKIIVATAIATAIATAALLILGFVFLVLPRIELYNATKEMLPECEAIAEYFTDFALENEDTYTVSNEYFSIDIPAYLSEKETIGTATDSFTMYGTPDGETSCVLIDEPESYPMSMIEAYEEYDEDKVMEKYHITDVERMFTSLGYGRPDSFYNVMKCVYLLDYKDYDFWDLDKMVAFSIYGIMRTEMYAGKAYLYEKDDIRALVECHSEKMVAVSVMQTTDLNKVYSFMLREQGEDKTIDMNEVFGILNSFQFVE